METGLSSDPEMNWRVSSLDRYQLVSNSDAHSPPALAREATLFATELDYFAVRDALRTGDGLAGTIEFFPEEGKYHADGHRACGVNWEPAQTREPTVASARSAASRSPSACCSRVEELADRPADHRPDRRQAGHPPDPARTRSSARSHGVGARSKTVEGRLNALVAALGPELRDPHRRRRWTTSAGPAASCSPRPSAGCAAARCTALRATTASTG